MLFNSLDFLVFFPLVTVLYFLVPHRFRWIHLLVASCVFYMFFIPVYILILLFTITLDYFAGIAIEKAAGRRRKLFLVLSLAGNLGVLVVFKYGGFFTTQVNGLLQALHSPGSLPVWEIILPIGLSFHTFQAMSYTIEVYRGNYPAERHFGLYAVYVLFYPQLVAGPIERPAGLLRQLRERHVFNRRDLGVGLRLMLWGFFKKLVIADRLGGYVNYVYNNLDHLSSVYVVLAVIFFSFQIYCDFSGYSDIAIGAARTMGFRLKTNFDRPYFARNIREFWARWHISLTSWFRDYVYIPLGGNRRHWVRNILLVFLFSGLWHGAGWNFVIWGVLHGVLLVVFRRFFSRPFVAAGFGWIGISGTFLAVSVLWVFFRCGDVGQAVHVLSHLVGYRGDIQFEKNIGKTTVVLGGVFVLFMLLVERWTTPGMEELEGRFWVDVGIGAVALGGILLFGVFGSQPFIYFQF
jgi:D-alanyl-lipoteichoic acid acyltransferase DltB (MBOAT superfamily)